jgi:hypothetical protein
LRVVLLGQGEHPGVFRPYHVLSIRNTVEIEGLQKRVLERTTDMKHHKLFRDLALLFFVTALSAFALAAGRDKVKVQFDHPVHVNNQVLPAGHYTIEEMSGKENNNNVLEIYTDGGQKFETSFMTIDAMKRNPPPKDTKVVLERIGNDYYLDKIWIKGKQFGYQVPLSEQATSKKSDMHPEEVTAILIIG